MKRASPKRPQSASLAPAATHAAPNGNTLLRVPVEARGIGIMVLAAVAVVWMLEHAQLFFVPLLFGILLAYTLYPVVNALQRIRIPRVLATTAVMVGVLGALAFGVYSLRGQAQTIVNQLPTASKKLSAGLESLRRSPRGTVQKVESAARVLEEATTPAATPPAKPDAGDGATAATPPTPPVKVVIAEPAFKLRTLLLASSVGAIGLAGQVVMMVFLVFFLLLAGDSFKRKIVRVVGPTLSKKKITVTILDDINQTIQQYMFMLLITNALIGVVSWLAFHFIGLDNAAAWGLAAGVLHLIPYFGTAVAAVMTGMAAFIQFDSLYSALLVAGATVAIATIVGTVVTTWMAGRIAKMNTSAVFVSLLFWGWLWGVWGMLLSIPIIVIIKVISQRVEELHPVAEFLGE